MELRELPPGGREVQVLLGVRSRPPGHCLVSLPKAAWSKVRVGGWPACLPEDGNSRTCCAQPRQPYPSSSETGSGSDSSDGRLQPRAGSAGAALGLGALLPAGRGEKRGPLAAHLPGPSPSLCPFLFLCSSHITWDFVLLGLRHLFQYVLGPAELSQGC